MAVVAVGEVEAMIPVALQQDKLIELPDCLADTSVGIGTRAACDWHETDCNYTCQCSGQNNQCGIKETGCGPQCGTALCGNSQCGTGQCLPSNQICINCEGASCQSCQCSTQSSQGAPPSSSGEITINSSDITDTTITVHLKAIPGAAWYVIAWHKDGAPTKDQKVTELSYTFTDLTPEKKYLFNYYGVNNYGTGPYATTKDATTLKKKPVVTPWSWTISNGSATPAKTQAARRAILNEGYGEDFSYKVWNDLVNKINEVVVAIGSSWDSTYATLENTKITNAGQALTATKYNAARQNVGSRYSTGIQEVSGSSEFTWSYIDKLVVKLNEWITSL